jgi:hypothetical protein
LPRRIGAARLLWLHECRIMVRDGVGPLYLDFDGERWSVPYEGHSTHMPLSGR